MKEKGDSLVFQPHCSRSVMGKNLCIVGKACGIRQRLSYHVARHTFGTMSLSAGIPIESIAKMMGHASISSTQIYAQVTDNKISEDMDKLIIKYKAKDNNTANANLEATINTKTIPLVVKPNDRKGGDGMKTGNNTQRKANVTNQCSYFDWSSSMQIVRKGSGNIAMTEGELAKFFGATWSKLNHRLQTLMKSLNLHPDERSAGEENIYANEQLKGYAPLYPLPIIIALSFLLDSTEAHLFRKYVCQRLQKPESVITPIFLLGNTNN